MTTDTLALIGRPQGAGIGKEAISSLWNQQERLAFLLDQELASGLRVNPVLEHVRFVQHPRCAH